jgi:hypothetical protein
MRRALERCVLAGYDPEIGQWSVAHHAASDAVME